MAESTNAATAADPTRTVAVAGAGGDLGGRITRALLDRGAVVRLLVQPDADPARTEDLVQRGAVRAVVDTADAADPAALIDALAGTDTVVSAWNGLRDVIVDRQSRLIDAAVAAGVSRFIPSDYCLDYTGTRLGDNRNIDLRREFAGRADRASIETTGVLVGAFTDLLAGAMPVLQPRIKRVLYWIDADQPLQFTTRDDTAAVTAEVALDERPTPRFVRFVGDTLSARDLARVAGDIAGTPYRLISAGGLRVLDASILAMRAADRSGDAVFPAWQGMQYLRDMFSGRGTMADLDNERLTVTPTSVGDWLRAWEAAGTSRGQDA